MNAPGRARLRHLALLAATALALTGAGVAVERADLFPRLRYAVQRSEAELPSTLAVDKMDVVRGLPILSVYLDPSDLTDLLAHKFEHGRRWERRGTVTYFNHGRRLFAGSAGVRIHGGGSRHLSPRQSFRLFFRRRYGFPRMGNGVLFGPESQPLQRLVVHNDVRKDPDGSEWRLTNPLAYDLARRIGCITPETEPARFVLNGRDQGLYVLTEHFDDEYFESHMPGRRITMRLADMEALRARLTAVRPLTLAKVREVLDVDTLVSWFLSVLFAGTHDPYQGPGQFLDEDRERAGWFWVNWDMDWSFRNWDMESLQYLLDFVGERGRGRRPSEPRPFVIGALLAEDPAFRELFAARVDAMLNHQLTREVLDERRRYYMDVALKFGLPPTPYQRRIDEFLEKRPAFVRAIAEQWLNVGPSVAVTIRRQSGEGLQVDGFATGPSYEGQYFPGREVIARTADDTPARWFVNGALIATSPELRVRADRPLAVAAYPGDSTETSVAFTAPPAPPAPAPPPPPAAPLQWRAIAGFRGAPYSLTATEVTVSHYAAFARATARALPRQPQWSAPDHPVVNLTWQDAGAFCAWAGGRLPTEAEWTFAARAGATTVFPWGDAFNPDMANGTRTLGKDRFPQTAPAGSFPPNAFGLYDMIGNVWEWTADPYRGAAQDAAETPEAGALDLRTVRGGAWINRKENLRVSRRVGLSAAGRHNLYVGIRCAR